MLVICPGATQAWANRLSSLAVEFAGLWMGLHAGALQGSGGRGGTQSHLYLSSPVQLRAAKGRRPGLPAKSSLPSLAPRLQSLPCRALHLACKVFPAEPCTSPAKSSLPSLAPRLQSLPYRALHLACTARAPTTRCSACLHGGLAGWLTGPAPSPLCYAGRRAGPWL
jgi:hypothetical protein